MSKRHYFSKEIERGYLDTGQKLSPKTLKVLSMSYNRLTSKELEIYNKDIGPRLATYRSCLERRFSALGQPRVYWISLLKRTSRSISGELAGQVLSVRPPNSLPDYIDPGLAHGRAPIPKGAEPPRSSLIGPSKVVLFFVAVFEVLLFTGYATIGVHSYIVPRRMLHKVEEHLDQKEFLDAYFQMIWLGAEFSDCPQAKQAQIKYEEASLNYILEHVDALDNDLPPTVSDCIQGIDYQAYFYEESFAAAYNDADHSIYINVYPMNLATIDDSLLHEWGHAYSFAYLDQQEIIQYKNLRGIPDEAPWLEDYMTEEGDYDYEVLRISAGEDFAEVFKVVIGNGTWSDSTIYGEVENPEQMRAWIIDASML